MKKIVMGEKHKYDFDRNCEELRPQKEDHR